MAVAVLADRARDFDGAPDFGKCLILYCPGCEKIHQPVVKRGPDDPKAPLWTWNGDLENVTVSPSILFRSGPDMNYRCHSFVRNGKWQFLADCTHDLAGQTVPLPEIPERFL